MQVHCLQWNQISLWYVWYRLGHELCTLTAVPRSMQPPTFRGMLKWVSAFGMSNKWSKNFEDRPYCRGIFQWENFTWHLTASAAGLSEHCSGRATGNSAQLHAEKSQKSQYQATSKVLLLWGILSPIYYILGPIRVHISNSISIASTVFAGLTLVTDRQTNRPCYFVCSNRPHPASAAKQPNN